MNPRRADELLALTVDPLDDVPVIGLDVRGRVVQWSSGAELMTGYQASDVLSRHVSELYTEEDVARGRPTEDLGAAAEQGYSVRDGWRRRADGSLFWARTVIRSRRNEEGDVVGFVKLTCDLTDQRALQLDLVASDQRLAGLVELAADGIISADEDGRITLFNRGAERMFGYERHEVLGKPVDLLIPGRLREAHAGHLERFRAGPSDGGVMARGRIVVARAKDGGEFPIEATISKLELADGCVLSVILRSAREREAVEGALKLREERALDLANALPLPISFVDRDLKFVFANRAMGAWFRRAPEDLRGVPVREALLAVDSHETFDGAVEHTTAVLRGEERRFAARARRGDGSVRDVEVMFLPSTDNSGDVVGFYTVIYDLTERLADEVASEVRRATGQLLTGALDVHPMVQSAVMLLSTSFADECVVFLQEDEGRIARIDSGGQTEQIARGAMTPVTRSVLHDGHSVAYAELPSRAEFLVVPIPCVERGPGVLVSRWAAPFDMGRRQVETAEDLATRLAGTIDRIELANRSILAVRGRDWLLQKVTHDLGNPVASIVMGIDRMLKTAPDPDRRARTRPLLEGIAKQANEMRLTIEDLFDASALRTGRKEIHVRATESGPIVAGAVSLAEPIALARGIALEVDVAEPSPGVLADADHVRHALSALLSDVLGRSERGGRVGVAVRAAAGNVVFEVTGPGPDVSGAAITRLLDEGGPEAGGASAELAGAEVGLPLAIANEIIRAHGARLEVSSRPLGVKRYTFSLTGAG